MASQAVAALRSMGPDGLNALLLNHAPLLAAQDERDDRWRRLRVALDSVAGQKDAHASRLYWHTNFEQAKAEAGRTGRPILSLRLLGNLDEELSCANSRFFRTTLYANKEVSDYLRTHFVLHWKSVRPVPRITIDMGDGRRIERTITGNSIHYVLAPDGEVVDALPGLHGARAFLNGLKRAEAASRRTAKLDPSERASFLRDYHTMALSRINQRWANDVILAGAGSLNRPGAATNGSPVRQPHPAAAAAMPLAFAKSMAERPLLNALSPRREALERSMDDELWARIAALHTDDVALDANAISLIRAKTHPAGEAMLLTHSKRAVEDPMLKTIQNLQRSISEDTVRNEYTFHGKIHEWLAAPGTPHEVEALNTRVYAELFLTPESDPWLGLAPQHTFSALDNGGMFETSKLPGNNVETPNSK
jgi:hypothetical protein